MGTYSALPRAAYRQQPRRLPRSLGFERYTLSFDGVDDHVDCGNDESLNCFPPDTLIFANPEVKPISDIALGEKVLGHFGDYQRVTRLYRRHYKGELVVLHLWNLPDIKATPNHPILAVKTKRTPIKIGGRHITCPPLGCSLKNENWCRGLYRNYKEQWIPISELEEGDFIVFTYPTEVIDKEFLKLSEVLDESGIPKRRDSIKLPSRIKVDGDFLRLVGYYLAEGSFSGDTLYFSFSANEREYIEDAERLLRSIFNAEPKTRKENGGVHIYCCSRGLGRFFERLFGNGATNKRIPSWLMLLPIEKQRELLRGYLRGDGHLTRKEVNCVTVSLQLAHQLRIIFYRLGVYHSFYVVEPRSDGHSTQYEIQTSSNELREIFITDKEYEPKKHKYPQRGIVSNGKVYIPIRAISTIPYDGLVYNLEVENSHSYNTISATVHNCTHAITIEAWVKPIGEHGSNIDIGGICAVGGQAPRYYHRDTDKTLYVRLETENNNITKIGTANLLPFDEWHFTTITYDGEFLRLYVDGVLDVSEPATGNILSPDDNASIGAPATNHFFNGTIALVRIYKDYALTPEEIRWNMLNYHNPVHPEYLVLWLPLEEGSGGTVYDKSGHGNNGTLLPADDPPTWTRVRQWELRASV